MVTSFELFLSYFRSKMMWPNTHRTIRNTKLSAVEGDEDWDCPALGWSSSLQLLWYSFLRVYAP